MFVRLYSIQLHTNLAERLGQVVYSAGIIPICPAIDAVKAKWQCRKIKRSIKIMFIIAMVLAAIGLALGIYVLIVFILLLVNGPF